MSARQPRRSSIIPLLALFALAACGATTVGPTATAIAPPPAPTVSPSPQPTVTVAPTATGRPTVVPTATIAPPPPILVSTPVVTGSAPAASAVRPPSAVVASPAPGAPFTDPKGRFTFVTPKGWIAERYSDPDIVVQLNGDTPPGSFNVSTEMVSQRIALAQYIEAGIAQVRGGVAGYEPGPRGTQSITLGAESAGLIDYYATVGGARLYFLQIIAVRGETAYVLTFNTQPNDRDAYLAQAQIVLDSWRFG